MKSGYRKSSAKKVIAVFCLCAAVVVCPAVLAGCDENAKAQITPSYFESALYTAEEGDYFLEVRCGAGENPFLADGKTNAAEPFTTLRLRHIGGEIEGDVFTVSGREYKAEKIRDMLVLTVRENLDLSEIRFNDTQFTLVKTEGMASGELLSKGMQAVGSEGEIYASYSKDVMHSGQYRYFVACISPNYMKCVLLDVKNGEILARSERTLKN